ncbi:MAG TPA: hypothetical protein VGC85_05010 [Chthoniobacterales bacterium]
MPRRAIVALILRGEDNRSTSPLRFSRDRAEQCLTSECYQLAGEPPWQLLVFRARPLLDPKNGLARFHQVETIAGNRLEISRIVLQQTYLALLAAEKDVLLAHLPLEQVDVAPDLREPFMLRNEETNEYQRDGDKEQRTQNAVELLPDGRFAARPEIAVAGVVH